MAYKLKIGPAQGLKLKGQAGFALPMLGGIGIKATKSGGIWTVDLDYSVLGPGPVSDPATAYIAIEDKTAGVYREVSLASLLTSGLDADLQAIAALTSNGVLVRTADDTWALRTITGTANEITVTDGDGVSGNPTVSLPDALTFTGKAVTGGSFAGLTITTSTYNGNTWTAGTGTLTLGAAKTATISNTLTFTGTDGISVAFGAGGTVAYQGGTLAQFAATTSAQLRGVLSDETGTGFAYFQGGDIGTPSAGVATNLTDLPLSTGITGFGTGVATFLATPSSANLRAALTDETGTGVAYFVGGALGTPASGVATNLTGTASGLTAGNVTTNANLTGDVTSVGNATTIGANKVTNAMRATMAAYTLKGNATGSTANEADIDVTALTSKASPVSADIVLIQDSAASNAFKKTTVGALASAGSVASYNGRTGAVTATTTDVPLPNYLSGLALSTAGSSSTFGIAAGFATDSTNASMMALGSAYTKTTSAWAVGSTNGALDTGTIANNTWYHVYLIKRTDTGVVDVLISTSATSPTLPTNYTLSRRIGSMLTNGSAQWVKFIQDGDWFTWDAPARDIAATNPGTSAVTRTLSTPLGVRTNARIFVTIDATPATATAITGYISDLSVSDLASTFSSGGVSVIGYVAATTTGEVTFGAPVTVFTNTSSQIRSRLQASAAGTILAISTIGWIDRRGRD